jgi:hypothetical protein
MNKPAVECSRTRTRTLAFTLAEVLTALVLAAVLLPVVFSALGVASGVGSTATARRRAALLADTRLRELVVTEDWIEGDDRGTFEDEPDCSWELETDEWTAGDITLRRLDLTVTVPGRGRDVNVTLTTLVQEPNVE